MGCKGESGRDGGGGRPHPSRPPPHKLPSRFCGACSCTLHAHSCCKQSLQEKRRLMCPEGLLCFNAALNASAHCLCFNHKNASVVDEVTISV